MWLPERENQRPDQRLQLLRGTMQLLSHLQLQGQLGVSYRRRACLLATPGPLAGSEAMRGAIVLKNRYRVALTFPGSRCHQLEYIYRGPTRQGRRRVIGPNAL